MKRLLAALLALMMLLTMTSCAAPDAAETDDKLTLVAFNVGKADALLLTSGDTAYLIDTGTEDSWADLSRALEALGVTHLTGVIVTHMDKDHYGGAKQLAESDIAIDGWYASWAWEKEKWKKHPVVKAAAVRGEEITLLQPGDTLSDGLLTVIGPIQEREESENDNSLVLVASGGGGKMLLTGDMEYDEENDLLAAGVIPSCEVLKVGASRARRCNLSGAGGGDTAESGGHQHKQRDSAGIPREKGAACAIERRRTDCADAAGGNRRAGNPQRRKRDGGVPQQLTRQAHKMVLHRIFWGKQGLRRSTKKLHAEGA